ncbi:MAG: TDT family transporter [Methanomassiliicoccaceae archaeon]|nr:TDT family transporter [Methanomassiliicoccaceae archaeon]
MRVREFISKVPVPVCGLSLGLACLDTFLSANYDIYSMNIFMLLSFVLVMLFTVRMLTDRRGVLKDIENPAAFSVLPTYTMTLMLMSAYVKGTAGGIAGDIAEAIWFLAMIASFVIMFFFVKRFLFNFSLEKVFPGWIIIFVGYVVASVTSPAFGMEDLGKILFWAGLAGYLIMMPLTAYRVFRKGMPEPLLPSIAIFAAPVNLCVVGCLSAFDAPPEIILMILAVLGVISYAAVICYLPAMLGTKFYPSYSCLTFPFVISAVSFFRLGNYYDIPSDGLLAVLQQTTVAIAAILVVYVLVRYVMFFYRTARGAGA